MLNFVVHTPTSAPTGARTALESLQGEIGLVPNMAATMASSPQLIEAFVTLRGLFARTPFTPVERELILLATGVENRCGYCVAVHSTVAVKLGIPAPVIEAIRSGKPPDDQRLRSLVEITRTMAHGRGAVSDVEIHKAEEAGMTSADLLNICLGIMVGTLVSFVAHLVPGAPLDEAFRARAWQEQSVKAG